MRSWLVLLARIRRLLNRRSLGASALKVLLWLRGAIMTILARLGVIKNCLGEREKRRDLFSEETCPRLRQIERVRSQPGIVICASRVPEIPLFLDIPEAGALEGHVTRPGSPDSPSPSVYTARSFSGPPSPISDGQSYRSGFARSNLSVNSMQTYRSGRSSNRVEGERYRRSRGASRVSGRQAPTSPDRSPVPMPSSDMHQASDSLSAVGIALDNLSRSSIRESIDVVSPTQDGASGGSSPYVIDIGVRPPTPPSHDLSLSPSSTAVPPSLDANYAAHNGSGNIAVPAHSTPYHDRLRAHEIIPITTLHVSTPRYTETVKIPLDTGNHFDPIVPVTLYFPPDGKHPSGWANLRHPEGAVYFYNEESRVYTNSNLYDPENLHRITVAISRIEEERSHIQRMIAQDAELVLELSKEDEACYYYMVDHTNRTLFWLNPFDPNEMLFEVDGVTGPEHMKHEIECHYWTHWELFPHRRQVSQEMLEELTGILLHCSYDAISSQTSTAPYSPDDLQSMSTMVKRIPHAGFIGGYGACVYGRMMATFAHERFLHFAGTVAARLNRNQSVYEDKGAHQRTWLITILSVGLFFAPDVHLKSLERTWVDHMINEVPWKKFIKKLEDEWKDLILLSTVLLAANTALLEVPDITASVDAAGNERTRSPDETLCYVSIVASIGSIIIGLLLVRHYRTKARDTAAEAATHLNSHSHPTRGLETLAILYSLPYAGLMWGMVTFLGAFASLCIRGTALETVIPVVCVLAVIMALITWCIITGWESEPKSKWNEFGHEGKEAGQKFKEKLPSLPPRIVNWLKRGPDDHTGDQEMSAV